MFEKITEKVMNYIPDKEKKIFMGDFNYDVSKQDDESKIYLVNYLKAYELQTKLPTDCVTTNLNTQIDVIFTNFDDVVAGVYETYFSYHKPIYAILQPKSVINGNQLVGVHHNDGNNFQNMNGKVEEYITIEDPNNSENYREGGSTVGVCQNDDLINAIPVMESRRAKVIKDNQIVKVDHNDSNSYQNKKDEAMECITIEDQNCNENNRERDPTKRVCRNDHFDYAIPVTECRRAMSPDCYLTCGHINLFHEILNRASNDRGIFNFAQDTGYVQYFLRNLHPIPVSANNIQVVYSGAVGEKEFIGHWICTKYDGNGNVHIYDSINTGALHKDQIDFLNALYPFQKTFIHHRVQQQPNLIDCGVFAIYFATLLYHGQDPSTQTHYNNRIMRNHVSTILLNRQLLNFPEDGYRTH